MYRVDADRLATLSVKAKAGQTAPVTFPEPVGHMPHRMAGRRWPSSWALARIWAFALTPRILTDLNSLQTNFCRYFKPRQPATASSGGSRILFNKGLALSNVRFEHVLYWQTDKCRVDDNSPALMRDKRTPNRVESAGSN